MTIIHMVFFKFRQEVSAAHRDKFVQSLKQLKRLACVKDNRLLVGGPSVTVPIERSQGYHYALLSYHEDYAALEAYQASKEHHDVTEKLFFPYKEDLCRFDFQVDDEDEHMCNFVNIVAASLNGKA